MLSIGEFSRVTQLSIKALRLYHERGILIPDEIDDESKYRYYQSSAVEKAFIIKTLKDMGFSLNEIKQIIMEYNDDKQIVSHIERKLEEIDTTMRKYEDMKQTLSLFLQRTEVGKTTHPADIEDEVIPDTLICGIRFKGKYDEIGEKYGILSRKCGRYAKGKPFTLYYDGEYKENDADIEACLQVKKKVDIEGIDCRELKGGNAVTLIHKGPYEELGRSYQKIFEYVTDNNLKTLLPTREQYIKGPGMIFMGNPQKYITKLMLLYE